MSLKTIAVASTTLETQSEAKRLAKRLYLDFVDEPNEQQYDYYLVLSPDFLGLKRRDDRHPLWVDFSSGKMRYRSKNASLRHESLAKAIGIAPRERPYVVDATTGLGRDSFILASLGYSVTMIERSPIVHALLEDGLNRGSKDPELKTIIDRLTLIQADAIEWLKNQSKKPDVIYLDPMFPERKKTASVKKEMVFLQEILGKDSNFNFLLSMALSCAIKRVVVKRPRLSKNPMMRAPTFSVVGKSTRFEVYII